MATLIREENVKNLKEDNQGILNVIARWDTPCEAIRDCLSSGEVGPIFKANFGIGRRSHEKISELTNILQEMEGSIRELVKNTDSYLDRWNEANQDNN